MNPLSKRLSCLAWIAIALTTGAASARDLPTVRKPATGAASPAQGQARRPPAFLSAAVTDEQLDAMRGGFDVGNGLQASFGIQRVVYINGNLVARTSVNIPDVAHMTTAQASALAAAATTVHNGSGNVFVPGTLDHGLAATVIQNSLDNQDIKSLTTIDVSVNNLNQFHSMRLADSLQNALIGSLGH